MCTFWTSFFDKAPVIEKIKIQAIPQAHAILQAEADAKAQEMVENSEKATEQ